uniref:Uncharacterized protein n=1 Tax=Rhizophagus irregularis (strain DAOM 181602 / DAOM 197198 / MUCL 43194) TaxID=747089 RepID=U9U5S3_RHIID
MKPIFAILLFLAIIITVQSAPLQLDNVALQKREADPYRGGGGQKREAEPYRGGGGQKREAEAYRGGGAYTYFAS